MVVGGLMLGWLWRGVPVGLSSGGRVPVWFFLHKTSQPFCMIVHPSIPSRYCDIHKGSEHQVCQCCAVPKMWWGEGGSICSY